MSVVFDNFATEWQDAWNNHDIPRILSHYSTKIIFHSLKAEAIIGKCEIKGKDELKKYWSSALDRQPNLRFQIQDVLEGPNMMVITYLNHNDILAAETLYFDDSGLVYRASACHRKNNLEKRELK